MKRLLTIIAAITLFYGIGRAQQFPVQVTPQLLPPYSVQVSDYYSPGAAGTKLNLLLLLRDFNKPQLQVRLRMSIEGQSVSLRTREDAVFTPITIQSGTPTYIDPSDLAQYFNPANLDFSGITRQQYEQTGKLPEGFYTFCFEAIETATNQSVSNKGCTFAWMTLNEPPILNIPRKAEAIIPAPDPQTLIFQWTPRHTASPTAAFTTDYTFTLVEMGDDVISPEAAFITAQQVLKTEVVTATTVSYTAAELGLSANKKYAWRVQAKAKNGVQDLATFRNQGYSETFWFIYQNNCVAPSGASASAQGQRVTIEWTPNPLHLEYKVEYREANDADAQWFEIGNTLPRVSIGDLTPGKTYEYRVGGACEYGRYTFGNMLTFTANDSNATTVPSCGLDPNLTDPPQNLLQTFSVGDTIFAGDYEVIVTQVSGQTSFSGEGYVKMSWLAGANVAVRFTNIGINTDKKLASGVIETTYDPTDGGIGDLDEYIESFKELLSLFDDINNYTSGLQENNDADPNKISDLVTSLNRIEGPFLNTIENDNLRLAATADFQNLNTALSSLANGQSCQCETGNVGSGGGNYFKEKIFIYDIECCKQIIQQSLTNIQTAGNQNGTNKADEQAAIGNYLFAGKYHYLSPIETPVKLPDNAKILIPCTPSEGQPWLMKFQINNEIYEAKIEAGKFYGYFTASQEEYDIKNVNEADIELNSDGTKKVYGVFRDNVDIVTSTFKIRQILGKFNGSFQMDKLPGLANGVDLCWDNVCLTGGFVGWDPNTIDISDPSKCTDPIKGIEFGGNKITKKLLAPSFNRLYDGDLHLWMDAKQTYGEVFIHKIGEDKIRHFSRNTKDFYIGENMENPKSRFERGDLLEDYALWIEYDAVKQTATIYQKFKRNVLDPKQEHYAGDHNGNFFAEKIKSIISDRLWNANLDEPIIQKTPLTDPLPDDGQYRSDELWFWEWALFGVHELKYVVNNGTTSPRLWNDHADPQAYNKSPMNWYAPVNAGADEGLEVVKDLEDIVGFVGECIKDPEIIKSMYEKVKELKYDDLKRIVTEQINQKYEEYNTQGARVRQYHLTRDGIDVVKTVIAAPMMLKSTVKNIRGLVDKSGDILQSTKKFLVEIADEGIKSKIDNLASASKSRFLDFIDKVDDRVRNVFKTNPRGIDAWSKFDAGDFDEMDNLLESAEDALTADQKLLREAYDELDEFNANNWPQDEVYRQKKINGARPTLPWKNRKVGSTFQNKAVDDFCTKLDDMEGVTDIRINQTQTDHLEKVLGINRPDVQFTYDGKRYYIELDAISSPRSIPHKQRIHANDAAATLTQDALPEALKRISINVNGTAYYLKGSITLWDDIN